MIRFGIETFEGTCREAFPLLVRHWKEICPDPRLVLNPDIDTYLALEKLGKLLVVTARDDDKLIGYFTAIVTPHLHYKDTMLGAEDIHYIAPEYRKGWTGVRLIKAAIQALKERGAQMVVLRTKAAQSHGKLFERLGLRLADLSYIGFI